MKNAPPAPYIVAITVFRIPTCILALSSFEDIAWCWRNSTLTASANSFCMTAGHLRADGSRYIIDLLQLPSRKPYELANWQIGKFIGSYGCTAKGHQYQAAGGRPVFSRSCDFTAHLCTGVISWIYKLLVNPLFKTNEFWEGRP